MFFRLDKRDERDRPAPCRRGGARGLRRRCGRAPLREARHHRLVAGAGPKRRDLRGRQPPGAGAVARRGFRRSATFRPTAPRGGATSTSPSGSLRHLAAPRSSSGAPNPRLLNPHRLHVDLPRNRFDRQSFTCDVVKLEYTYPQQVHRRNALTRTVGTNPSSEGRRMLRAGGGRPERHLRAVRRERCAAHPDDLRRHAGQVAWTGDSVISPIRAWPHRRFGAGRRIAPFLLRSWCRLSAAGFFYARKRGLVERTQGVDLAGRGQGHRPAERGCGHAEGAASWKKGSDTCLSLIHI